MGEPPQETVSPCFRRVTDHRSGRQNGQLRVHQTRQGIEHVAQHRACLRLERHRATGWGGPPGSGEKAGTYPLKRKKHM